MRSASSSELNHAKFWTAGEPGNINQNSSITLEYLFPLERGILSDTGHYLDLFVLFVFLEGGDSFGLKCHIVKEII